MFSSAMSFSLYYVKFTLSLFTSLTMSFSLCYEKLTIISVIESSLRKINA